MEGGPGGDEKAVLWGAEFPTTGERGDGPRIGEDKVVERGDGATGWYRPHWFSLKMGIGATVNMADIRERGGDRSM